MDMSEKMGIVPAWASKGMSLVYTGKRKVLNCITTKRKLKVLQSKKSLQWR